MCRLISCFFFNHFWNSTAMKFLNSKTWYKKAVSLLIGVFMCDHYWLYSVCKGNFRQLLSVVETIDPELTFPPFTLWFPIKYSLYCIIMWVHSLLNKLGVYLCETSWQFGYVTDDTKIDKEQSRACCTNIHNYFMGLRGSHDTDLHVPF